MIPDQKRIWKPYTLVVTCFGHNEVHFSNGDGTATGTNVPLSPVIETYRFWSERQLRKFAADHGIRDLSFGTLRTCTGEWSM